jgi:hypothetical protein
MNPISEGRKSKTKLTVIIRIRSEASPVGGPIIRLGNKWKS